MIRYIQAIAIFLVLAIVTSLLVSPLRHPFFNRLDFNSLVLLLQAILFALLVKKKGGIHLTAFSTGAIALVGFALSDIAYALTTIFLDRHGTSGMRTSLAHASLPNYLLNTLFFSFFSYCWVQLPVSVALEEYFRRRVLSRA
jgi:hypothetical protein